MSLAIAGVAVAAFLCLNRWLGRRTGRYVAPGSGAAGGGTAMIAVGGVLVAKGHLLAGVAFDLLGALSIWVAFRNRGGA